MTQPAGQGGGPRDDSRIVLVTGATSGIGFHTARELIISRYREELHRHEARRDAMAAAIRQALPPVLASAATVTIALLCLLAAADELWVGQVVGQRDAGVVDQHVQ